MSTSRILAVIVALAAVVALVVGGQALLRDDDTSSQEEPTTAPQPAPAPPVKATPARPCATKPDVVVRSAADLEDALADAKPGTSIRLQDGTYAGEFQITRSGTEKSPIELCGTAEAVLDGGPTDGGYTLHLDGAAHWRVVGITLQGGQKGLMLDAAVGNVIDGITVRRVGDEAIHLRTNSTDNVVTRSTVRETGLRKPEYGEGLYVGSAESNWCELNGCDPDRSDRNVLRDNDIAATTAESVDLKEGTSNGVLQGNTFSGDAMVESDSWVDVKGNGWRIVGNRGTGSTEDGFQVHQILDGWGRDNTFTDNVAVDSGPGYGINVTKQHDGNVVSCSNVARDAGEGMTNIDCT
jgi:hypothetical protein